MKCPNCGKEIANDSLFCEFCGAKVKKAAKKWVPWVAGILAFIVSFVVVSVLLDKDDSSKSISRAEQCVREVEAATSAADLDAIEAKYDDLRYNDFTQEQRERINRVMDKFPTYGKEEAVEAEPAYEEDTLYAEPAEEDDYYYGGYVDRAEAATQAIEAATSMEEVMAVAVEYQDLTDDDFTAEQQARMQRAVSRLQ